MPHQIRLVPLPEIDATAIPRDRTGLDPEPQAELERSIAADGLRQPVELFPLPAPRGPQLYGLLTGFRRLHAFETLHAATGQDRFAAIPAFLRPATDLGPALAAMVAENDLRADLSPWERGLIAVRARNAGAYPSIEEAIAALHPHATRGKRTRLRTLAFVAEEFDGLLTTPERLSERQCLRLARALEAGFGELLETALEQSARKDPAHQATLIDRILTEAEENARSPEPSRGEGRPRRIRRPRAGLVIRRERTREGWSLHFTGRDATGPMMDSVLDEVERMYAPG